MTRSPTAEVRATGEEFREAMRHLAGAANVVTVADGGERTGLLAISVSSFSAEPPTIFLGINRASSTWRLLSKARRFCVNILSDDQAAIADRFAGRGGVKGNDRYAGAEWTSMVTGAPVLVGALASIDCDLDDAIERHSHFIVLGRVRAVQGRPDKRPLLYWRGAYRHLAPEAAAAGEGRASKDDGGDDEEISG